MTPEFLVLGLGLLVIRYAGIARIPWPVIIGCLALTFLFQALVAVIVVVLLATLTGRYVESNRARR